MKKLSSRCSFDPLESETALVYSVTQHLLKEGYRVQLEASNMGQSIDVVATKGRYVTAIEAKISNWRRALDQCRAHTLVADFVVIALGLKKIPEELSNHANNHGWGLLSFNSSSHTWIWEIRPKINYRIWKPERLRFIQNLKRIDYAS